MLKVKSCRYIVISIISFSLILSPINPAFFVTISPTKASNLIIETNTEWSGIQTISGYALVVSSATLTIKKGAVIEFDGQVTFDVAGNLIIEGTPSEPVIFKKKNSDNPDDYYTITTTSSGKIRARNMDVFGGGLVQEAFIIGETKKNFFQRANAIWMYSGAFSAQDGGTLDIEGANFHNNALAVYADQDSYDTTKVWRSKFSDNTFDFVNTKNSGLITSDIRYNWWGDATGPEPCVNLDECEPWQTYKKVLGKVDVSDWATERDFKDPVVVVPGIMGSWKVTQRSDLELDPVFGIYDDLIETLDKNGYVLEKNLFPFPYEWLYSNAESAKLLKMKINEIKTQQRWPKVDIVAHSMGGLVAREYIGTLNGGNNIDQLITLGTPHNGAPKSYLMWESGVFMSSSRFDIIDFFANKIFQQNAEENGYDSVFEYVRRAPVASVKELLPVYSYLRDKDSNVVRTYPDLYPANTFLQNLKTPTNIDRLNPLIFTNIVGKTSDEDTIKRIRVGGASIALLDNPEAIVLWGHGKPDGYDDLIGDKGLELGVGDGTVPLESAQGIIADEIIELSSNHGDLPADAAKTVFKTLTGLAAVPHTPLMPVTSILLFMPFSPIDIQIISPTGKKVGKNFENGTIYDEIPGAYYTGYDTENEFITIPNPEEGEYRILTQGTETGAYRIEAVKITEGTTPSESAKESLVTFAGMATPDATEEKKIELLPNDTVISKEEQDDTPPTTEVLLSGTQGTNGWYTSDVSITLSATDNENGSGIEKTEYSLDNGATWSVYTDQVILSQEGTTMIQYFSTDKQGNHEAAKALSVKIDKTAPEAKIVFNPDTERLVITGTDNISQTVSVKTIELRSSPWIGFENGSSWLQNPFQKKFTTATLLDEAGHQTRITFENRKKSPKYRIDIRLQSLAYDGVNIPLPETFLRYQWQRNSKKQYRFFIAYIDTNTESIVSHYSPKYDETLLTKQPKGSDTSSVTKQKLPTMIILGILTEKGKIQMTY